MTEQPTIMEWMRNDPLPAVMPDSAIVIGGTRLLSEFFHAAGACLEGSLAIAVPYIRNIVPDAGIPWDSLNHGKLDVTVVAAARSDAEVLLAEIGAFPWRSLLVRVRHGIHCKVYAILTPDGSGSCLLGSHNLTRSGAVRNHEAGTLFLGRNDPAISGVVRACHEHVTQLARGSKNFYDSLCWPAGQP